MKGRDALPDKAYINFMDDTNTTFLSDVFSSRTPLLQGDPAKRSIQCDLGSIAHQIARDNDTIALGTDLKDLAFVGRSNVGKSSLVNILLGGNFAQTSKHPGKTKTLTFYPTQFEGARIVDCPGYGFAAVGH